MEPLTATLVERGLSYTMSSLSVLGATMVISSVFRSKENRKNIQQRLVGFMCISDFIMPFLRLSERLWLPYYLSNELALKEGLGNEGSCKAYYFLGIGALYTSMLYNGSLVIYYILIVKYNWRPWRLKKIHKWLYIAPVILGSIVPAVALILDGVSPYTCNIESPVFQVPFFFTFILLMLSNIICCLVVYFHVRYTEKRALRFAFAGSTEADLKRTKQVATQFAYFAMVFVLPTGFFAIFVILLWSEVRIFDSWFATLLFIISTSLIYAGGFLNAIVYFRLRFQRMRNDENSSNSRVCIVGEIIRDTLFPCCCKPDRRLPTDCEPMLGEGETTQTTTVSSSSSSSIVSKMWSAMFTKSDEVNKSQEVSKELSPSNKGAPHISTENSISNKGDSTFRSDEISKELTNTNIPAEPDIEENNMPEEKTLTPGAFENNTSKFPGESEYTVPSTYDA